MISIRRKIEETEQFALSFQALAKVFTGLANALPNAALPASPELSEQCRIHLRRVAEKLLDTPSQADIDQAGETTLTQVDEICRANRFAMEERDGALKDVVTTVAGVIKGFKGHGERHESSLGKMADQFEELARIGDPAELRRQLQENVARLRQSVEQMRREADESVREFEHQLQSFEERLEAARRGSSIDKLTRLGSRREAERQMGRIPQCNHPVCILLFDIEGFREINARYGAPFGDKLLQALAHTLKLRFRDESTIFRWGADEFLVIAKGVLAMRAEQCRGISESFSMGRYSTFEGSVKTPVKAALATGAAEYVPGESMEALYRRARASLEQNRENLPL